MSTRIEVRTSWVKNKSQKAFVHSKIEVVQNFSLIQKNLNKSQAASKHLMKRRNPEACAITGGKRVKKERKEIRKSRHTSFT
jgi:hypothetical protein